MAAGHEEVVAAGLCLALTLTGSNCVGPSGGQSLKEWKVDQGWRLGLPGRYLCTPCWPYAHS